MPEVVRGLVIINPGNPTGQAMPADALRSLVRLCAEEDLVLLADEVRPKLGKISKIGKYFCKLFTKRLILQIFGGLVLGCIKSKFCKKICV